MHQIDFPEFQEKYDKWLQDLCNYLGTEVTDIHETTADIERYQDIDPEVFQLLMGCLNLLKGYYKNLSRLDFLENKYTPKPLKEVKYSDIKHCKYGYCHCGMMLYENRDVCCRKCKQWIDWSTEPNEQNYGG